MLRHTYRLTNYFNRYDEVLQIPDEVLQIPNVKPRAKPRASAACVFSSLPRNQSSPVVRDYS
jgi:hypothetical protein